ncbi:hypothetical protein LCGC14_3153530, partial [marine sediment metagenome]
IPRTGVEETPNEFGSAALLRVFPNQTARELVFDAEKLNYSTVKQRTMVEQI